MATWSHLCNSNGKLVTMQSEDETCSLCKTTYTSEVEKRSRLMPELPQHREKQIPMLFKAFKNKQ
jgi:hypothetical protein